MDIKLVLDKMLTMLLMLIVGVIAAKTGVVDAEGNRRLSRYAIAVPQCATILASAMNMQSDVTAGTVLGVLGVGCVMYALLLALGVLMPRLARIPGKDRGLYSVLTIFGNVGFMGIPLAGAIFGSDAVFYAALLVIPFNLLLFTFGIRLISGGTGERFDWRRMINPALVSSVAAVVIIFLPVTWPSPVTEAVTAIGDMILPLSMTIVGASLGEQKLRDVLLDWRLYLFAPVRLIVAPVLLWACLRPFVTDPTLLGTITVAAGMPCAAVAAMLSIQYGANEKLATRNVFMTTLLSVGTIPLVCWVLLAR